MTGLSGPCSRLWRCLGFGERRCGCCGVVVEDGACAPALCGRCRARLTMRTAGFCPACGKVFADPDAEPHLCADCLRTPPPWDELAFYGVYEGLLRELILGFKFSGRLGVGHLLGELLVLASEKLADPGAYAVAAPVPLHGRRIATRGYNQSLELARLLSRRHGLSLGRSDIVRTRHTLPQSGLSRQDKIRNIHKAFSAAPEAVEGKRVLLVDDVMTTGSTVRECTKTLARAGAASVGVLVLARTGEGPPVHAAG